MSRKMKKYSTKSTRFGAALAFVAALFASFPAQAQYMSFFGDSTWKYQYSVITRPPQDYIDYPPETPNALGVYCITISACFSRDNVNSNHHYKSSCHEHDGEPYASSWYDGSSIYEDTTMGRLFHSGYLICDMSLSVGDTFVHKGQCYTLYDDWEPHIDTVRVTMIVDSIQYLAGRKIIFLSLLDHQDDYFFGTGNQGQLNDYNLSIRFIEGIGPTYGLLHYSCYFINFYNLYHGLHDGFYYLNPQLNLLQCMYKDDSLVYLAHEGLDCDQSCFGYQVGLQGVAMPYVNLYPNPAAEYVVLDLSTGEEMDGLFVITDMLGRQCLQQEAEGTKCQIPVADLPTGMYFLTYKDGRRTVTKKFLKK